MVKLQDGVYRHFLHEGITFTVLDADKATEQIIPIDCVPRLLTAGEWEHIERGLKQRLAALNLFLKDVYHEGPVPAGQDRSRRPGAGAARNTEPRCAA